MGSPLKSKSAIAGLSISVSPYRARMRVLARHAHRLRAIYDSLWRSFEIDAERCDHRYQAYALLLSLYSAFLVDRSALRVQFSIPGGHAFLTPRRLGRSLLASLALDDGGNDPGHADRD
jgi:hypothetical protein